LSGQVKLYSTKNSLFKLKLYNLFRKTGLS
jgi:hypothetical protein